MNYEIYYTNGHAEIDLNTDGAEFATLDDAKARGIDAAREAREAGNGDEDWTGWHIQLCEVDEDGHIVGDWISLR